MKSPVFSYWNGKGRYQAAADALNKLVPASGPCADPKGRNYHLDLFRRAGNAYYDLFNNGLCNRGAEFRALLHVGRLPRFLHTRRLDFTAIEVAGKVDVAMDKRVINAAIEQGIALVEAVQPHDEAHAVLGSADPRA